MHGTAAAENQARGYHAVSQKPAFGAQTQVQRDPEPVTTTP